MKKRLKSFLMLIILWLIVALVLFTGCRKKEAGEASGMEKTALYSIAVFVPGVAAGSPVYEMMVEGAERAASEYDHVGLKVIEGGFNQAEWAEKVTSLAATGEYDLILSSNPAMPFVSMEVAEKFPGQKFLNVDGYLDGHPQIATVLYNQVEQAYFVGYLGGLVTRSKMPGANPDLKVGMVVAQEYPVLLQMIRPGYEKGLKAVDPGIEIDYRVIGNWYDANKAADLANSMMDAGVDVILCVAGGANQGVIKAAQERGRYVLFFDSNEYRIAPGTIVGCGILGQGRLVYEKVKEAIEGKLVFGKAEVVHAKDGYVDFVDDDPLYINNVPEDVRREMEVMVKKIRSGELCLEVPRL